MEVVAKEASTVRFAAVGMRPIYSVAVGVADVFKQPWFG